MRAVILLNPKKNVEYYKTANQYAEASIGFDYNGAIDDNAALAAHLRELASALEAKTTEDKELF